MAGAATVKFGSGLYVATMASAGTTNDDVVQVAFPALPFTDNAVQPGIVTPLATKVTVPAGETGVSRTPLRAAVKVTGVSTTTGPDGAADKPNVGVNGLTVCVIVPAVATV
jgi:hypothetical protein